MVNHIYLTETDATVCGQHSGHFAWCVSGGRTSCPECIAAMRADMPLRWRGDDG